MTDEWKPTVCVYHGGCIDGFTAAWAVWKRWPDTLFVPGHYGKPLDLDLTTGDRLLFVDFSLKREEMIKLGHNVHSIVVLDHHKTAEAELEPWKQPVRYMRPEGVQALWVNNTGDFLYTNIVTFFDMHQSGARMAWDFCHGQKLVPEIIKYVEDRDLWRFQYPQTKAIHRYLSSQAQTFQNWCQCATDIVDRNKAFEIGSALLADFEGQVRMAADNAYIHMVGKHCVPTVNVPYWFASDVGHALLKKYPDAPFAATWYVNKDGVRVFSLRSEDSRMDVSEVAKTFGGGGHRNAAGFASGPA